MFLFRNLCKVSLLLLLYFSATGMAQEPSPVPRQPTSRSTAEPASISGRVVLPSGHPVNNSVKIRLMSLIDEGMYIYTDNQGAFSFTNLGAGIYTVEVSGDPKLYETVTEQVNLTRGMRANVVISLKEKNSATSRPGGNVVSAAELDSNVPSPAKKEYEAATRLANDGKYQEAINRYKRALEIYPAYLKAHNDLGAQYLKLKRLDEAAAEFEAAIDINAKAFNPQLNLGIVLVQQKKFSLALDRLTLALSLDSTSAAAHLYFGIASAETDNLEAAQRELKTALSMGGDEYALAHFYLAVAYMKSGEKEATISELKSFLATSPTGEEAERARQLLKEIGEGE